ncbi:MAG: PRK06851 family protein [Syntrophomonadaceae bacterium]
MAKTRHYYPGGNTCLGFFSFYDYIVTPDVIRKIILKGGPGTGKSIFMKKIGEYFLEKGHDIEYHWCSSDNHSLDGVVIGNNKVAIIDGTNPHIVDPRYPGAVDEIINLGQFWNQPLIKENRDNIIQLTNRISRCFRRAYIRLQEAGSAYTEWKTYFEQARQETAVNRNIKAFTQEFLQGSQESLSKPRHLFAGAITPQGAVTRADSLISSDYTLFAVKGSPGSGIKDLFNYALQQIKVLNINVEVLHNPFYPEEIDIILLPETRSAMIDISSTVVDYASVLPSRKYKRLLDFDQLIDKPFTDSHAKLVFLARDRFQSGINDAVTFIQKAKSLHDELESYYIPAMDFSQIDNVREEICNQITEDLSK